MADIRVNSGGGWVFLALLIIYFWGDPDLHDLVVAAVKHLQGAPF